MFDKEGPPCRSAAAPVLVISEGVCALPPLLSLSYKFLMMSASLAVSARFVFFFRCFLRPHVFFVDAQLSLCTDVDSQCCTSTDPDLSGLVVTAPWRYKTRKQSSIRPAHSMI